MYKLSGHSLTRGEWFLPESQPFTLTERDSTCTIQLGPGDPEIGFNDWILDDEWPEGNYVWRVKNLCDTMNTETRTIELEHVIKLLDDKSLFGQVTTQDISGGSTATAKQAVQYILGRQSDWTLGDFAFNNVSNPYEFSGETLLDALEAVTNTLEDPVWEYDMSVYPFILHIRQRSNTVSCEMRAGRNLSTLKRSVSRSGMYTRLYPIGKNDLHVSGNYLSKNESTYGRVDHIETDQSKSTVGSLQAWAQGLLNRHCEPTVSITISGLELSGETGEALDNLKLNKMCRCPLPEFGTTITERIVKKQWRDRRKEPENVTLNLCNSSADVASIIKEQTRSGGRGAAGQAKQNYLFEANGEHLYYEVFDECGYFHGVLNMTSQSLRIAFDNAIQSTRSEFQMTSESLRIAFENETQSIRSVVSVEAGKISQIVSAVGANGEVTAASIIAAVNNGSSSIVLSADHIDINGVVSNLEAYDIEVASVMAGQLTAEDGVTTPSIAIGSTILDDDNLPNVITALQITSSGNTYTLQKKTLDSNSWTDVGSFNRAASQVTLSGAWSGRTFSVTASPSAGASPSIVNGVVYDGIVPVSGTTVYDSTNKNVKQDFIVYTDDNGDADQQIMRKTLTISATSAWNAGHTTGGSDAGVQIDTSDGKPYSIERAVSTNKKSFVVSADASISYNSTTHKYTATAKAKADSTEMDSDTAASGTEAYEAGVITGQGYVYTGVTAREVVSSGGTAYYEASNTTVVGRGDKITGREVVSTGGTVYYPTTAAVKLSRYNSSSIKLYYKDSEGDYNIAGTYVWWYENSSGTQYYTRGTGVRMGGATDYYKGNGGTKTVQSSTLIRLGAQEQLYRRS